MSTFSGNFATTHWSVVLAAGKNSTQALETLCSTYWYPLYAFIRRRGHTVEEAQDLTQEFFAHILEKRVPATLTPEKGRFRAYLLTAVNHFLVNDWIHRTRQKRGGKQKLTLDFQTAEANYLSEAAEHLTPEKIYARRWACELLQHVLTELKEEYKRAGKTAVYDTFQNCLWEEPQAGAYAKFAESSGLTESAARSMAHRMRKRYRVLLRDHIAQTVDSEDDIDNELAELFAALAGN